MTENVFVAMKKNMSIKNIKAFQEYNSPFVFILGIKQKTYKYGEI